MLRCASSKLLNTVAENKTSFYSHGLGVDTSVETSRDKVTCRHFNFFVYINLFTQALCFCPSFILIINIL